MSDAGCSEVTPSSRSGFSHPPRRKNIYYSERHSFSPSAPSRSPRRTHRGACGCEANTGDGAGILVAMPDDFLSSALIEEQGVKLPPLGQYAVGQVFMPRDEGLRMQTRKVIEDTLAQIGRAYV